MLTANDFTYKQVLFLVPKDGEKLSFNNDNVVVKNKDGKVIHQSTCYRLFAVFVIGHLSITTGLIQRAKKFGFAIVLMTTSFRPYQIISSFAEGNVLLRKKQYSYSDLDAGKAIIKNKIENQRLLLLQQRNKESDVLFAIQKLDEYLIMLPQADSIRSIMGYEGSASRIYFKAHFNNIYWQGRKPRIKFDMVNALLDIGYTILFSYIDSVLAVFGFDRYYGFLHTQFYMRKSLTCDIVEPFRVLIDKQVKKSINLGQFKEKDFEIFDGKWCLKYKKTSEYSAIFLNEINTYKEDIFIYIRDFYRAFMKERLNKEIPVWNLR